MRLLQSVPLCLCCSAVTLTAISCGAGNVGDKDAGPDSATESGGLASKDASVGAKDAGVASKDAGADALRSADAHGSDAHADAKVYPDAAAPSNDHCASATMLSLNGSSREVDVMATTLGATHDVGAPCASDQGADVFYSFVLSLPAFVYADTFGASWNTLLYFLASDCTPITTSTTPGDAACNDDACATTQSQAVALLAPGTYILGLTGTGGDRGAATIHFQWVIAGSGTATQLPQGNSTQMGTTVGSSGNIAAITNQCIAAGPENTYWWTNCPNDPGGTLTASTCGGATWETVLEAEIPISDPYTCSVDSCNLETTLAATVPSGAGERVLCVDGQGATDKGAYTLTVSRP
jgi:hypothetical protein